MYISDFSVHDFRSYSEAVLHFEPGIVALIGENGQGKTNLVEAIEYLSTFSSHRVSSDIALVRQGASAAVVRARAHTESRTAMLEIEIVAGRANRARLNRGHIKPTELLGIVRTVVFSPQDLALVTGDPATRRRFLDGLMVQQHPRMRAIKADYDKVLKQRAALLKNLGKAKRRGQGIDVTALDVWDFKLAQLGAQIVKARAAIIAALRPHVEEYYRAVSGAQTSARIDYDAHVNSALGFELPALTNLNASNAVDDGVTQQDAVLTNADTVYEALLAALRASHSREIDAGLNLVGPHRDDMRLGLGTLPAKGYASHGESWSFALALKLASWQFLRSRDWGTWDDDDPILILDDVFAELDARRRERLVGLIMSAEQVFITAAVGDDVPTNLDAQKYFVCDEVVTRDE